MDSVCSFAGNLTRFTKMVTARKIYGTLMQENAVLCQRWSLPLTALASTHCKDHPIGVTLGSMMGGSNVKSGMIEAP